MRTKSDYWRTPRAFQSKKWYDLPYINTGTGYMGLVLASIVITAGELKMIRVAIIDNGTEAAENTRTIVEKRAERLLKKGKIEIHVFTNSKSATYELREGKYFDVFLLETKMPVINGLDLAKYIRSKQKEGFIVFLTSHPEFAVKSYDKGIRAYQYILKEEMKTKLPEVLDDIFEQCIREEDQYYYIFNQYRTEKIRFHDIIHVKKDGKNCILATKDGIHTDRTTIMKAKQTLNLPVFILIDRGSIVNMEHVEKICKKEVHMSNGDVLEISRANVQKVRDKVLRYWGVKS